MCDILYVLYYGIMIAPVFVSDVLTTNVSGLIETCPVLYYGWALAMSCMMVVPQWHEKKARPLLGTAGVLFVLSCVVPWKPWLPGWVKDIHVWGQIAGIVLCSLTRLPDLVFSHENRAYFFLLGISFTLMCLGGQVTGLSEIVFGVGLGLITQFHIRR